MLAHVAVTIARAPKGPPTTSEGAANAGWIGVGTGHGAGQTCRSGWHGGVAGTTCSRRDVLEPVTDSQVCTVGRLVRWVLNE